MGDSNTARVPAKLVHYITYGLYRAFELFLKPFPLEVVCVAGGIIGSLGQFLVPRRRRIVIRNLRIVYGSEMDIDEIRALCRRTYWNIGANFLASVRANTMHSDTLHKHIDIIGAEQVKSTPDQASGAIFLLAHMGSWETLVQIEQVVPGVKSFGALYRPLGNPLLDRLVKRRRQKAGITLYSRKDGFFPPISHLKKGGILGVFSDQNARHYGVSVPLFGKLSSLTNLPVLLHRRAHAPIFPVSMATTGLGKWQLTIHPAIKIPAGEKANTSLTTSLCAQALETIMSKSPADVLWMHGYWKINNHQPLIIVGTQKNKTSPPSTLPTKPFKVLVFAGSLPADSPQLRPQLNKLKNYRSDIEIILVSETLTHPSVTHHIPFNPSQPPSHIANQIRQHDLAMERPIDCALDFTPDASGSKILESSGISSIFSMSGKYTSRSTKRVFTNPDHRNLEGFLRSLGVNAQEALQQTKTSI